MRTTSKIVLAVTILVAIVGAAKAYQITHERYCQSKIYVATTTDPTTLCTSTLNDFTLAQFGIATQATTILGQPCVATFIRTCLVN